MSATTIKLEKTIFHRGKFIREVTVRQPTQADIDEACALSDSALGRGIALVSAVCNLDEFAVIKMGDDDKERIEKMIEGSLG